MASSILYEKSSLDHESRTIRLIKLSSHANGDLQCSSQVCPLEGGPPFVALSYEWGPAEPTHMLKVDGYELAIRENLMLALRTIVKHQERINGEHRITFNDYGLPDEFINPDPLLVWTDAICIDQGNITERNEQIQLMSDIYSRAVLVLVWLGPASEDSDFAVKNIHYQAPSVGLVVKEFQSVYRLLCRAYWTRMWVVQEFLLAAKVLVYCGDQSFAFDELYKYLRAYKSLTVTSERHRNLYAGFKSSPGARVMRAKRMHIAARSDESLMAAYSLDALILQWKGQDCEDVRDKVFALLGLPFHNFKWKQASVVADYLKTPEQVYGDVLDTLRYTRLGRKETDSFCLTLMRILKVDKAHDVVQAAYKKAVGWGEESEQPRNIISPFEDDGTEHPSESRR